MSFDRVILRAWFDHYRPCRLMALCTGMMELFEEHEGYPESFLEPPPDFSGLMSG